VGWLVNEYADVGECRWIFAYVGIFYFQKREKHFSVLGVLEEGKRR
jgi:hypothetical protein